MITSRENIWIGAVVALLGGGIGFVVGVQSDWRTTRPTVPAVAANDWSNPLLPAYIGNEGCASCHAGQAAAHATNGHSRTFFEHDLASNYSNLLKQPITDPERKGDLQYASEGKELIATFDNGTQYERLPIQFALGSGAHATTFINLLADSRGEPTVLEHRFSLFHHGEQTGLTPSHAGLSVQEPIEELGRLHQGKDAINCIACHTTTATIRGAQLDNVRPSVGCESCHGPGREHAAAMQASQSDLAIRFVRGRSTALEEIQMCGRCHRLPEMLSAPPSRSDPKLARFQPVGLLNSDCYRRSEERLRCTTCHDPHQTVDSNPANYTSKCVNCHSRVDDGQKLCPHSPKENCVSCHMPKIEVHPGISFHDHWIRIRPAENPRE